MSGTIYSYKPAAAGSLEGASTVLTLKTGELLELRRGAKTRWSVRDPAGTEPRKRWASLEEWNATLPAGAEVTVHGDPEAEAATVATVSDDFRRVREMLDPTELFFVSAHLKLHTNKTDAARLMVKCRKAERMRDRAVYAEALRRHDANATMYRRQADGALAAAPYRRFSCRRAYKSIAPWLMARRAADGVFIPLFIDLERNLFFTPVRDLSGVFPMKAVATLAELDLEPVFLVRTNVHGLRMVSL
jgi:hypothetical protein